MKTLGIMSGTSLDAVDFAILESDGAEIQSFGPRGECKLPGLLRNQCLAATRVAQELPDGADVPNFEVVEAAIADFQADAVLEFLAIHGVPTSSIDAVGFHGQTVMHRRPQPGRPGRSVQLGDAHRLARRLGRPVVYDLRSADLALGGQGAPLAPVYHAALARWSNLKTPVAVLNLGGVGNITWLGSDGSMTAFDTGPANGPLDQLAERHGRGRCDRDGAMAAEGRIDEARIRGWLGHPYFAAFGPKSLDRYEFTPDLVADMSPEDGAATLSAFAAAAVEAALHRAPALPTKVIVSGGGRHNPVIMRELRRRLPTKVVSTEEVGWAGDSIEAEAWAFLAVRSLKGLPVSFPETTGASKPVMGGKVAYA